jgi:hypothetical protein
MRIVLGVLVQVVLVGVLYPLLLPLALVINLYPSEFQLGYWQKLNPFWIIFNDDDPIDQPKYNKRYMGKPHWYRVMRHMFRNPLANGCRYTWGFKDKSGLIRGNDMWPVNHWICITPPWLAFKYKEWNGYAGWNVGFDPNGMNFGALTFAFRRQG